MMYNLFLDDERFPQDVTWIDIGQGPYILVRNQVDFMTYILINGIPNHISFDNDLGDGMGEGRHCAQWLIDAVLDGKVAWKPFTFTVHSMNNVAAEAIRSKLNQFLDHMSTQGEQSCL